MWKMLRWLMNVNIHGRVAALERQSLADRELIANGLATMRLNLGRVGAPTLLIACDGNGGCTVEIADHPEVGRLVYRAGKQAHKVSNGASREGGRCSE